jgi:hypothetical protein
MGDVPPLTPSDDSLLDERNLFHWTLDTEVATRDHLAIESLHDFFKTFNCVRTLDLGDYWNIHAVAFESLVHCLHIVGSSDETRRNEIHLLLDREVEFALVRLGRTPSLRSMPSMFTPACPPGADLRADCFTLNHFDRRLDGPIIKQYVVAGFDYYDSS